MLRKETMQLMAAVALLTATISIQAHNKVVVVPLGGDEAPTFKTIFVTPETYTGDLKDETKGDADGQSGADRRCMEYAEMPDSKVKGKTFKAWLSSGIIAPSFLIFRSFGLHNLPYHNTNGDVLFDNLEDFDVRPRYWFATHSGQWIDWDYPVPGNQYIWSGINKDGTYDFYTSCHRWENGTFSIYGGAWGRIDKPWQRAPGAWTEYSGGDCESQAALLCIEQ